MEHVVQSWGSGSAWILIHSTPEDSSSGSALRRTPESGSEKTIADPQPWTRVLSLVYKCLSCCWWTGTTGDSWSPWCPSPRPRWKQPQRDPDHEGHFFNPLAEKKTMSFREYKDTIEENDLGKSNKTENPQFLFIYYHTKKTWFKGIVSRDFEVLQIIFMKRTWFLDVPLEVYLFLNFRFYIVL